MDWWDIDWGVLGDVLAPRSYQEVIPQILSVRVISSTARTVTKDLNLIFLPTLERFYQNLIYWGSILPSLNKNNCHFFYSIEIILIFVHFFANIFIWSLLLRHWYEIMALYYVKSILTEILASRQDRRVLQKSKIIRIEFLSKWGMLQTSRYV